MQHAMQAVNDILTGYMKSQNTVKWSIENFFAAHGTLLQPVKIGVCVQCLDIGLLGPFSSDTITLEHYIYIIHEFLGHLTEEEISEA
jgi:hypothetical protein